MNSAQIINRQLEKTGNTSYLKLDDWISMEFKACVYPLWRKKSSAFEDDLTEIGTNESRYFSYIGPSSHDITTLDESATLISDGSEYKFKRKNAVKVNDETLYYTGILKAVKEAEYDEY